MCFLRCRARRRVARRVTAETASTDPARCRQSAARAVVVSIRRTCPPARSRRHSMSAARFMMIPGAPAPVAPFSHAVEVDGWMFLTGQMPTDPNDDGAPLPVGIEAQTHRVMDNLVLVLNGAGLGLEHVVAARAFLTN